jgi:2-methylisocitrate lyase-like PEP mutase family enzyme
VIIARSDARGAHGGTLEDAINRANAYLAAGADLAFVEGPTNEDEVRTICKEVDGPVFYNQTGISPRFSREQMTELGIAATILPGATLRVTMQSVYDFAVALRDDGVLAEQTFFENCKDHPLGDFHTFAGFDQVREWEEQYLEPEALAKYADSVGHQPKR